MKLVLSLLVFTASSFGDITLIAPESTGILFEEGERVFFKECTETPARDCLAKAGTEQELSKDAYIQQIFLMTGINDPQSKVNTTLAEISETISLHEQAMSGEPVHRTDWALRRLKERQQSMLTLYDRIISFLNAGQSITWDRQANSQEFSLARYALENLNFSVHPEWSYTSITRDLGIVEMAKVGIGRYSSKYWINNKKLGEVCGKGWTAILELKTDRQTTYYKSLWIDHDALDLGSKSKLLEVHLFCQTNHTAFSFK